MNLTQSNIETGNHFKQVSCISVREYLFVSLKNWKHTIVNWLGPPGAKFDFIVVIIKICLGFLCTGFPGGPVVKDPPASAGDARDTSLILALEDPLEKEMAASPVFLPGKSHGLRSLAGYSPWGHKESDTTEYTHTHTHTHTVFQRLWLEQWDQFLTLFTWIGLLALHPTGLTFTLCAPWSLVICLQLKCIRVELLVLLTLAALEHFRHLQHITALVSTYKLSLGTRGIYLKASSEILWQIGTI